MSELCKHCGHELDADDKFCRSCGATRKDTSTAEHPEPPTAEHPQPPDSPATQPLPVPAVVPPPPAATPSSAQPVPPPPPPPAARPVPPPPPPPPAGLVPPPPPPPPGSTAGSVPPPPPPPDGSPTAEYAGDSSNAVIIVAIVAFVLLGAGAGAFAIFGNHHHHRRPFAFVNSAGTATYTETYTTGTQTYPGIDSYTTDTYGPDTYTTDTYNTQTQSYSTTSTTPTATATATATAKITPALPADACVAPTAQVRLRTGMNLSCPFAQNIVTKLTASYDNGVTLQDGPISLRVSSPETGETYAVSCTQTGRKIDCHNDQSTDADNGHGNNDVTFPASLVR